MSDESHGMGRKRAGLGLGLFSLALGAAELVAGRRIARALNAEDHTGLVRGLGARGLGATTGKVSQQREELAPT